MCKVGETAMLESTFVSLQAQLALVSLILFATAALQADAVAIRPVPTKQVPNGEPVRMKREPVEVFLIDADPSKPLELVVIDDETVDQEPVFLEPVHQAPVYQGPIYQELVYQEPVHQAPVHQAPLYQELVYQEPVYQEPVHQEPVHQERVHQELVHPEFFQQAPTYVPEPVSNVEHVQQLNILQNNNNMQENINGQLPQNVQFQTLETSYKVENNRNVQKPQRVLENKGNEQIPNEFVAQNNQQFQNTEQMQVSQFDVQQQNVVQPQNIELDRHLQNLQHQSILEQIRNHVQQEQGFGKLESGVQNQLNQLSVQQNVQELQTFQNNSQVVIPPATNERISDVIQPTATQPIGQVINLPSNPVQSQPVLGSLEPVHRTEPFSSLSWLWGSPKTEVNQGHPVPIEPVVQQLPVPVPIIPIEQHSSGQHEFVDQNVEPNIIDQQESSSNVHRTQVLNEDFAVQDQASRQNQPAIQFRLVQEPDILQQIGYLQSPIVQNQSINQPDTFAENSPSFQQVINVLQSANQQSANQQSAVQQSANQQSANQQSANQQSANQQSAVQQSANQQSANQQSAGFQQNVNGFQSMNVLDYPVEEKSQNLQQLARHQNTFVQQLPFVQPAPVQQTPVEPPVQFAPVQQPPVQFAPVQQPPVQFAPVQQTPVQFAPVQQPPVQFAPVQFAPVEPPVQQTPVQFAPVQQTPVQFAPVEPPVQQPPVQFAPVEPPVHQPPVQFAPVQQTPVQFATVEPPVQFVPVQQPPVQQPPVQFAPVQQPPVQFAPVEPPVQQTSVQQTPVQFAPVQQPAVQFAPVEPPVQQTPVQFAPVQQPPVQQAPVQQPPVQQPPFQQPPVQQPPVQQPPVQQPPVEQEPMFGGESRVHAAMLGPGRPQPAQHRDGVEPWLPHQNVQLERLLLSNQQADYMESPVRNLEGPILDTRIVESLMGVPDKSTGINGIQTESTQGNHRGAFGPSMSIKLAMDMSELMAMLPAHRFAPLVLDYLSRDSGVARLIEYAKTPSARNLLMNLDRTPQFQQLVVYLHEKGFPAVQFVNLLHTFVGVPGIPAPPDLPQLTGGVRGLTTDALAMIPTKEFQQMLDEKMKTNPELAEIVTLVRGTLVPGIMGELSGTQEYQEFQSIANLEGLPVF